ncbi:MAG: hypothetical protein ACYSX0_06410, partial [Planctomycetota bacterium]
MPSDERDESVLAALGAPMNVFRSSLAATAEQVRTTLASRVSEQENGRESESAVELGVFADERINFERFSNLLTKKESHVACSPSTKREVLESSATREAPKARPTSLRWLLT